MNNAIPKKNWLSGDITAGVEPPPITLIKSESTLMNMESEYVKINRWRNPASATPETYETKLVLFENVKPEDYFSLFIISINILKQHV